VPVAPSESPFASALAETESLETTPAPNVKTPLPSDPSLPKYKGPAVAITPPEKVFAPLNVRAPAPAFVNANAPLMAPFSTTLLVVVSVEFAVRIPAPLNVNAPVPVPSPNVTPPPSE
jgi:hypothetical protein